MGTLSKYIIYRCNNICVIIIRVSRATDRGRSRCDDVTAVVEFRGATWRLRTPIDGIFRPAEIVRIFWPPSPAVVRTRRFASRTLRQLFGDPDRGEEKTEMAISQSTHSFHVSSTRLHARSAFKGRKTVYVTVFFFFEIVSFARGRERHDYSDTGLTDSITSMSQSNSRTIRGNQGSRPVTSFNRRIDFFVAAPRYTRSARACSFRGVLRVGNGCRTRRAVWPDVVARPPPQIRR